MAEFERGKCSQAGAEEAFGGFENAYYCIYMRHGESGGPLLVKTPGGLAFLYCATEDLARNWIAAATIPSDSHPLRVSELGSSAFPIPPQWRDVKHVLLIDSEETLGLFFSHQGCFPFERHMGTDRIA